MPILAISIEGQLPGDKTEVSRRCKTARQRGTAEKKAQQAS